MHGETHESAKGRGGVTGCRYGLELLLFVRCSSGLPVIWRACTHRMPHVRLLQERQGQNVRKRCRYVADYKQESAQLSQAHRLSQNQPYRIWCLLIWLKSQHYHSLYEKHVFECFCVFFLYLRKLWPRDMPNSRWSSATRQCLPCTTWLRANSMRSGKKTAKLQDLELLIYSFLDRFFDFELILHDFTQYFISDKLKCIAADLYRLPCDACQPWNWMTVLLSQLSRPRTI